jgi:hypothetical protein
VRLERALPASNDALRAALYRGAIFLAPPSRASLALVERARRLLAEGLGGEPRRAHARLGAAELFAALGALRRRVYLDEGFHELTLRVLDDLGFARAALAIDPARLRAVLHRGHENPLARAAYLAHRDTWYANPDAVLACWIPLDDLDERETFAFYPDRFAAAVDNDSAEFDYAAWAQADWRRKIGWQEAESGVSAHYPSAREPLAASAASFACRRGEQLLFSGAHLHRTLPQAEGTIRFNLDFRVVHLADVEAGRGAPNVDNRARGSCLADYLVPGRPWKAPG